MAEKKVQKSIHFDPQIYEHLRQRAKLSGRSISNEVLRLVTRALEQEAQSDRGAIPRS